MASKKSKASPKTKVKEAAVWPKVETTSHLTITRYENGKVDMVFDWDQLEKEVAEVLAGVQKKPKTKVKKREQKK